MPKTYPDFPPSLIANDKALNLNNDAFYKVVTHGQFGGQANVNVFYYRVGLGLLPGGLNFGGAEALAWAFKNQVWTNNLRDVLPIGYTLVDVTVYPFNGSFDPMTNLPYTLPVNETGTGTGGTPSSAAVIIAKFNIEGQVLGQNGWLPPKKGYMAFGPYRESDVDDTGRLTPAGKAYYAQNLAVIAQDIANMVSLVNFWPCRIKTTRILDVITLQGFSDVSSITIRDVARWRKSRLQEA